VCSLKRTQKVDQTIKNIVTDQVTGLSDVEFSKFGGVPFGLGSIGTLDRSTPGGISNDILLDVNEGLHNI
jgi:hypothetical protein